MHVKLTGDSKLTTEMSVGVHGCWFHLSPSGPAMNRRPVKGVPRLSPDGSWDTLQLPYDPELDQAGKKMEVSVESEQNIACEYVWVKPLLLMCFAGAGNR